MKHPILTASALLLGAIVPLAVVAGRRHVTEPRVEGRYAAEQVERGVFRKAKHMGGDGRPVLPPMPWTMTASLPDEDIVAIYAYLRTIPPIRNHVEIAQPPAEVQAAIDSSNQKLLARIAGNRSNGGDR